jgi:ATP-dependent RNA helicase DDX24/MAK5
MRGKGAIGRTDQELDGLPVEHSILDSLQRRLKLALEIDKAQHKVTKANSDEKWMRDAAEAMELDISEASSECVHCSLSFAGQPADGEHSAAEDGETKKRSKGKSRAGRRAAAGVEALKAELRHELDRLLFVRDISQKCARSRLSPSCAG